MTDQPVEKTLLPALVQQNPAPFTQDSQDRKDAVRSQVDRIMGVFLQLLPSNYVSQVMGPHYTLQFQAAAERIADFQITAQEVFADSDFDYTRSEVLYQIIGSLVFPDAATDGYPNIDGDITYRTFLKRMVALLLQGATKLTVEQGIALLTDATVTVIEKGVEARKLKGTSAWGVDDQFTFEVDVTGSRTVTSGGLSACRTGGIASVTVRRQPLTSACCSRRLAGSLKARLTALGRSGKPGRTTPM